MKYFIFLVIIVALILLSCEKSEDIIETVYQRKNNNVLLSENQKEDVIVSIKGYLVFKNMDVYSKILKQLDYMTDEEFNQWEKSLGFQSSLTYLLNVHKKVEIIESLEEFDNLKQQYSDKLVFECDGTIRLPFYATAWDPVLNIDGVMKIGNTLYKFEKDREYIIMDGGADDLKNLATLVNDTNKVRVFFPNVKINQQNLKSIAWGELDYLEFATGNNIGHDRIKAQLQLVNYNYTGYGYTNVYYTEGGFDLRIRIDAQRKGIFGWYSNKVVYNLINNYLNMSFCKLYNGAEIPDGATIYPKELDPRVKVNINLNDYTSRSTNQGLRYSYYYYYDYDEGYYPPIEPKIFNFTTTFWTSVIGEGNKKTFTYSNI